MRLKSVRQNRYPKKRPKAYPSGWTGKLAAVLFYARRKALQGFKYAPGMWLNNMGLSNKTAVNTRTSTGTVFDPEGLVVTTEPGEISIEGGKYVS